MTEASEIEAKLLAFLRQEIFAPEMPVCAETDLIASGFDSMSLVRVLLFIESTYGFWIPEKEINAVTLKNVRSLSAAVLRLLRER